MVGSASKWSVSLKLKPAPYIPIVGLCQDVFAGEDVTGSDPEVEEGSAVPGQFLTTQPKKM